MVGPCFRLPLGNSSRVCTSDAIGTKAHLLGAGLGGLRTNGIQLCFGRVVALLGNVDPGLLLRRRRDGDEAGSGSCRSGSRSGGCRWRNGFGHWLSSDVNRLLTSRNVWILCSLRLKALEGLLQCAATKPTDGDLRNLSQGMEAHVHRDIKRQVEDSVLPPCVCVRVPGLAEDVLLQRQPVGSLGPPKPLISLCLLLWGEACVVGKATNNAALSCDLSKTGDVCCCIQGTTDATNSFSGSCHGPQGCRDATCCRKTAKDSGSPGNRAKRCTGNPCANDSGCDPHARLKQAGRHVLNRPCALGLGQWRDEPKDG